VTPNKTDM